MNKPELRLDICLKKKLRPAVTNIPVFERTYNFLVTVVVTMGLYHPKAGQLHSLEYKTLNLLLM